MKQKLFILYTFLALSARAQFMATPLDDLGAGLYLNKFQGGLYEGGSNSVPGDHDIDGRKLATQVLPITFNGKSKMVFLCIGMSNTRVDCQQLAGFISGFSAKASTLQFIDGALSSNTACAWSVPAGPAPNCSEPNGNPYDYVRDHILSPSGCSEAQVGVILYSDADPAPTTSLPSPSADAYMIERYIGGMARAAASRYPNLKLLFLSSRIYGGYAKTKLNPEPYAYESGFSVKWVIQAQINQIRTGTIDPIAGDLSYNAIFPRKAPWMAWLAYPWASGTIPRSDGLIWCNGQPGPPCNGELDFGSDGTHPSTEGSRDTAGLWADELRTSPYTTPWFSVH